MAQWVRDLAVVTGFDPWPANFYMPQVRPKKKSKPNNLPLNTHQREPIEKVLLHTYTGIICKYIKKEIGPYVLKTLQDVLLRDPLHVKFEVIFIKRLRYA